MSKSNSLWQNAFKFIVLGIGSALVASASAEVAEVRLTRQYGVGYLPLVVLEEQHLIEKHAKAAGLGEIKTSWATLTGGAASNDALLSGSVDFVGSGPAPLIFAWAKTNGAIKGVAALANQPIHLNTVNSNIKTLADFTDRDRIATPAAKVSIQAIVLQIAAAKEFGKNNYAKLDPITVTMKHPDAVASLLSGKSEVNSHLATPPFTGIEKKDPRVHSVFSSYQLLGGPHNGLLLATTESFYQSNPKTYQAVLDALEEAVGFIQNDKQAAAALYIKASKTKESVDEIVAQLNDPDLQFTTTPLNVTKFSDFLYSTGTIKKQAKDWTDLFLPPIHGKKGS